MSFVNKINKISLWVLLGISAVILVLFFTLGSTEIEINNSLYDEPKFTNGLMDWVFILLGLTVALTIVMALVKFIKSLTANPKKGLVTLGVIVLFIGIFVISWFLGDATKLDIIGYEGTDNEGFWAQYVDMVIYATGILGVGTLAALLGTSIYSKLN